MRRRFRVVAGPAYLGAKPGGEFTTDPDHPSVQRRLRTGAIELIPSKPRRKKKEEKGDG